MNCDFLWTLADLVNCTFSTNYNMYSRSCRHNMYLRHLLTCHVHILHIYLTLIINRLHCKKRLAIKLFPARESLVNDIPAGDWKIASLFYSVRAHATLDIEYEYSTQFFRNIYVWILDSKCSKLKARYMTLFHNFDEISQRKKVIKPRWIFWRMKIGTKPYILITFFIYLVPLFRSLRRNGRVTMTERHIFDFLLVFTIKPFARTLPWDLLLQAPN